MRTLHVHESQVKRILYQPQESGSVESINITEDRIGDSVPVQRNSSTDSFAQIINSMNQTDSPLSQNSVFKKTDSMGDSFLNDINPNRSHFTLENSNPGELSNLGITEGVRKWIDSKTNSIDMLLPHGSGVLEVKEPVLLSNSTSASTPVLNKNICIHNFTTPDIHDLPIHTELLGNAEENKKIIREIVTEVTRDHMNDLMDSLSQYFLNLQMCISKQFVNQEEIFTNLLKSQMTRNDLQAQNEQLKEENDFLKRKINELWKNRQ